MTGNLRILNKNGKRISHSDLESYKVDLNYTQFSGNVYAQLKHSLEDYTNTTEEIKDVEFYLYKPNLVAIQGNGIVFSGIEYDENGVGYEQQWWFTGE